MRNFSRMAAVAAAASVLPFAAAQAQGVVLNPLDSLTSVAVALVIFFIGRFFWGGWGR